MGALTLPVEPLCTGLRTEGADETSAVNNMSVRAKLSHCQMLT